MCEKNDKQMHHVKYFYRTENLKLILATFNNNFNCFGVM